MARVRFDPAFIDDPRWERLGIEAYVQHSAACSYVVRTLSDGFVSHARARTLTPLVSNPEVVNASLVSDGMWREVEGGYHVCDCIDDLRTAAGRGDEQPSSKQVTKERERKERNKREWRERQANRDSNPVPSMERERGRNRVQRSTAQHSAVQASPTPKKPALPAHVDDDVEAVDVRPAAESIAAARAVVRKVPA